MIRIVKLTFQEDKVAEFRAIFEGSKDKIRNFPGCNRLELLHDINDSNVFMTYSYWNSEKDLNNYRNSDLFKGVWAKTKLLFNDKPQTWSVEQIAVVD